MDRPGRRASHAIPATGLRVPEARQVSRPTAPSLPKGRPVVIIQRKYTRNFAVLSREVFMDERLSPEALGVLCYLRQLPNDWTVSQDHLRTRFKAGKDKMQRIVRELIDAGWMIRQAARTNGRGTFAGSDYIVNDEPAAPPPQPENQAAVGEPEAPQPGKPEPGKPEPADPEPVKPAAYRELIKPNSEPKGSAPQSGASGKDFRKDLFERGVRTLRDITGRPDLRCRTLIGSWLKLVGDDAVTVLRAIDEAVEAEVIEPVGWIEAQLRGRRAEAGPAASTAAAAAIAAARKAEALRMVERGEWPIGGGVFVTADSPAGEAWERYFARFGRKARWAMCGRNGIGWSMPSQLPPEAAAA